MVGVPHTLSDNAFGPTRNRRSWPRTRRGDRRAISVVAGVRPVAGVGPGCLALGRWRADLQQRLALVELHGGRLRATVLEVEPARVCAPGRGVGVRRGA